MKVGHICASVVVLLLATQVALAEQFSIFPDRPELLSPDGRFRIRSVDHVARPSDFSGVFRSLILEDVASGNTLEFYSYVGRVAVAWSGNNFIIVTDYVSKRTSRVLVFSIDSRADRFAMDKVQLNKVELAALLPSEQKTHLLENDHVYLEVSRVEGSVLILQVWGYGSRDPKGFRLSCHYDLHEGNAACTEKGGGGRQP